MKCNGGQVAVAQSTRSDDHYALIRRAETSMPDNQPMTCQSCGAISPAGFIFCGKCGRRLGTAGGDPPQASRIRGPIIAVAIAAVIGAVFLARRSSPTVPATPAAAEAAQPAAVPIDITQLSPEERFDRLYRRVMQGAGTGDTMTAQFAPMALAAFEMLDSVDADTRYHAALIKLHMGDAAGAAAFGDSILVRDSSNLLGYVARGMAFRWQRDTARLPAVYAGFRRHAARELARDRPEYAEHRMILEEFRQAADGAGGQP